MKESPAIHIGLEGFTLPDLDPFALIDLAAQVRYTHVGIRLVDPATNTPTLSEENARRVRDHSLERGITLHGADIVNLEGPRDAWAECFSTVAACGATRLGCFHRGDDLTAAGRRFADFVAAASGYAITPHIEPVSYFGVSSIGQAAQLVSDAGGGGITVDTLHFGRVDDDLGLLGDVARSVPLWLQVCDGPALDALIPAGASADERLAKLRHESVARRLPPGEGDCGVADIVRAVRDNAPVPELVLMVESPDHERVRDIGALAYASACRVAAYEVAARSSTTTRYP